MDVYERTIRDYGKVKRVEYVEESSGCTLISDLRPKIIENCEVRYVQQSFGTLKTTLNFVYINGEFIKAAVISVRMKKNGTLRIVTYTGC